MVQKRPKKVRNSRTTPSAEASTRPADDALAPDFAWKIQAGTSFSHYRIEARLGSGAMGVVFKARDLKLNREVALKFLSPEFSKDATARKRFLHEAQAASAIRHENICTVHDIDQTKQGLMFISMDYYDGQSLRERLAEGPLGENEAIRVAIQIASGMAKAHSVGIVHRDIKPANVIITKEGIVKIVDFGLAKLGGSTKLTKTGSTLGTIAYMSPEQVRSEVVDSRTDIWSLGVVLYEMLSGELPFKGAYESAVMYSIVNDTPKDVAELVPGIQPRLNECVMRMLEKNGDDRPGSMQMVISALEEAQKLNETQRGHIWSVGHIPRQVALRLRRKSYTFYVICLVIGLSIVGYIRFGVKDKMREPTIIELKTPGIKVEEPAISPDGAWVAYVAEDTKGNRNICVASLDGNQIRQLTSDTAFLDPSGFTNRWGMGARNECPSFIGMTNQILYSSSGLELVSGDSTTNMGHWIGKDELRKIPVLGGSPSSVLADLSLPAVFSASPDGKWVAYLRNVRGHESLYYCGTDASDEKSVLDLPDSLQIMMKDLAWSPNSQSVALSAGKELILVEPFSGTTTSLPMGGYSISGVCWLTSKKLVLSAYSNEKADLYWVDRETAVPTRFTFGLGDYLHPRATIDGRKLVCLNRQHKHNLWSINAKTNEAKQITFEHHEVADASISFNGLRLSYRLDNRLILADRDGRNPSSILAQITGPIVSRAVWSHDDKYLAFSSRPGETFDSTDWRGIDDDLKNEQINTLEIATGIIRNAGKGRVVDWALGNRMILAQIDTSDDPRPDLYAVRSVESPGQDVMSFESYITPRFSPDAKNVLLGNESRTKLVKIDIETGKRTELWTSPDGGKIDGIQTVLMDGSTIIDRIMKDRPTKWEILRVMPGRQYASRILLLDSGYNYPTIATDLSFVIADKYSISSTVIMFDGFIP